MIFGDSQIINRSEISGGVTIESSVVQNSTISDSCHLFFASVADSRISGNIVIRPVPGSKDPIFIDGCTITGSGEITESKHGEEIHLEE
jgi:hypothetical protein